MNFVILLVFVFEKIKRRAVEREMEEREDAEMRRQKAESDRLFLLYQQEKEKQHLQDVQAISEYRLKQAVSGINWKKQTFLRYYTIR